MANKYANGKIYAIMSPQTDKMYIGSTTRPLHERFYEHKRHVDTTSREIIKYEDVYIELIEDFPCNSKKELNRREGHHILNSENCVNKKIAGQTQKERKAIYYKKNKEYLDNRNKLWFEENKDKQKEYAKKYRLKKKQINNSSHALASHSQADALQP